MKSEHINMRIDPDDKKLITESAASLGISVAAFLLACSKLYDLGEKAGEKLADRILILAREDEKKRGGPGGQNEMAADAPDART